MLVTSQGPGLSLMQNEGGDVISTSPPCLFGDPDLHLNPPPHPCIPLSCCLIVNPIPSLLLRREDRRIPLHPRQRHGHDRPHRKGLPPERAAPEQAAVGGRSQRREDGGQVEGGGLGHWVVRVDDREWEDCANGWRDQTANR